MPTTAKTISRMQESTEPMDGPNWKWMAITTFGVVGSLASILFLLGMAAFNYQMRIDEVQGSELQKHTSEIVRLQADTEYIKAGVDEIRGILRGRQ